MCEPKNGDDYGQKVREEMGKLEERHGISDRRPPTFENGNKYVTVTRFFMVLGAVVGFLLTTFAVTVWPDVRDMKDDYVPRSEENQRQQALKTEMYLQFEILREQREADHEAIMSRLDDLEEAIAK